MPRRAGPPVGLTLTSAAKAVSRAFDEALAGAGGTLPTWLVLLAVATRQAANQRELAASIGIHGATLTHHLNAMETDGLLTRQRDSMNRRVHVVELTEQGRAAFDRLRAVAVAFDQQLRTDVTDEDVAQLHRLLHRLVANVSTTAPPGPPFGSCAPDAADPARGRSRQPS